MRIALIQTDILWEDPAANHTRVERRIQEAAALGAQLVVLPEMFCTGFSMAAERIAQPPDGPSATFLQDVAAGLGVWILAGVPEQGPEGPTNNALLVQPDGAIQRYSKIHPFSFAEEHRHYRPGTAVRTFEVAGVRITPLICYDLRFPEPFRLAASETDCFVVIANWPERRRVHWQTLSRARAIENLCYVAAVNRVGEGGGLRYAGDSALFSPWGEPLLQASEEEAILVGEVSAAKVAEVRATFPALQDRRPEAYRR